MRIIAALTLLALFTRAAAADEIVLPQTHLERGAPLAMIYRLEQGGSGRGTLAIEWSDALGRLIDRRVIAVALAGGRDIPFTLDGRRAVALQNTLHAHLVFAGRTRDVRTSFIVSPRDPPWSDVQIIMWQPQTASQYAALKRLGVTAGQVTADRARPDVLSEDTAPLVANDMRWFVENIATDFYSAYHRWTPDRPVNWRFLQVQALYQRKPDDPASLARDPSLSDPQWLARVRERLIATVRANRPLAPLYYNLGDEPGIADLAAFWDFDFSDPSLAGMRQWLKTQYPSLAALNAEWGTDFARWGEVTPETTRQAMRRGDGNFSSWSDFKAWMDVAFARALRAGTNAVHAADPRAVAAIEGGQVPGWGGYDYAQLVTSVDAMELYDDQAIDIVRSLEPGAILLSTVNESGDAQIHHIWRRILDGERGLILWDPKGDYAGKDGTPGALGLAAAPAFAEIRHGTGALLADSEAVRDPVAVLYSPASMRVQWMLDWQPHPEAWSRRGSDVESDDNSSRASMRRFVTALRSLAIEPHFVTPSSLTPEALRRAGYRVVVLPHAIALSDGEAVALRAFVASGGSIVADVEPGAFDQHGRRRAAPPLADLFAKGSGRAVLLPDADPPDDHAVAALKGVLEAAKVTPGLVFAAPLNGVVLRRFRLGDVEIVALQKDLDAAPMTIAATLPRPAVVYDMREKRDLGRVSQLAVTLDGPEPKLFALAASDEPAPKIIAPRQAVQGQTVTLELHLANRSARLLRFEVEGPSGAAVAAYSGNLVAAGGQASRVLPLALSDPAGDWTLRVTDVATGKSASATLAVRQAGRGADFGAMNTNPAKATR